MTRLVLCIVVLIAALSLGGRTAAAPSLHASPLTASDIVMHAAVADDTVILDDWMPRDCQVRRAMVHGCRGRSTTGRHVIGGSPQLRFDIQRK